MTHPTPFTHLAAYNQWMNRKLYNAGAVLSPEQLSQNRGAFFGSILGTLNHLAVADTLWLQRIARHLPHLASLSPVSTWPQPTALDESLCESFGALTELRASIDEVIVALCAELTPQELAGPLEYASTKGLRGKKPLGDVLLHVFNHQTHHRGQVTTLFAQLGIDVGATDLILLMPNLP